MKLSEQLYNAFNAGDSVEIDFAEKAKALEIELELLKDKIEFMNKFFEDFDWRNQR